jgi:predicted TPR repeat methyltransferase
MLEDAGLAPSRSLDVLDAGCGTGLCGPLLAPYARRLTGIDLSPGMLAHAREKQVYDELLEGELTEYLRGCRAAYDVVASADTLVYFGGLEEVIAAAAGALKPGGILVLTLEHGTAPDAPDFKLEMHGRYTHARPYVERLLRESGLIPEIASAELRLESGNPVAGLVIRAIKRGGDGGAKLARHTAAVSR